MRSLMAVMAIAILVKTMDDFLDEGSPQLPGIHNLTYQELLPYSLLLFALATSLHLKWSVTLFFASYIIGMARDPGQSLPFKLTALQESLLLLLAGILLFSWQEMLTSLLLILVIQMTDDLMDEGTDRVEGRWNMATVYGRVEVATFTLGMALLALSFAPEKALCAILGALFVWGCESYGI